MRTALKDCLESEGYRVLTAADLQFAPARDQHGVEHAVSESTIDGLLEKPDRSLRQGAYAPERDGEGKLQQHEVSE